MFKLYKKKDNSFSIELTGTISVDDSSILSYEEYKRKEEAKLVATTLYNYLNKVVDNPYKLQIMYGYGISEYTGFNKALQTIANLLAENGEI